MKASEFFAIRAQQSAVSMELMTKDMSAMALATQKDTASMRIITIVTMLFLPGTFVAVRMFITSIIFVKSFSVLTSFRPL